MSDSAVESMGTFASGDAGGETITVQQFCSCCQGSCSWQDGVDDETSPVVLTCGHSLCANCTKTEWLDIETQSDTVFCLTCSERVRLLAVKNSGKEAHQIQTLSNSQLSMATHGDGYSQSVNGHLFVDSADEVCEDKGRSEQPSLTLKVEHDRDTEWTPGQKDDGMPLQEWVNANICENLVLKVVSPNTEQCSSESRSVLDDGNLNAVGGLMIHASVSRSSNTMSVVSQENKENELEEKVVGYIVNKSNMLKTNDDVNFTSSSEGVTVHASMLGSPDLNLKALLQMLEKNTEPSLVAPADGSEIHPNPENSNFEGHENQTREDNSCLDNLQNLCENPQVEMEALSMPEKQLCDQMGMREQWQPINMLQQEPFIPGKERAPGSQTLPCTIYFQNSDALSVDDGVNYACVDPVTSQSSHMHETGKVNNDPLCHSWFAQGSRDFPRKSNPRPRRGRKRKPLLRHFQSEFFMRPYLKREQSPQLQLVKLVRQRSQDKREEEAKSPRAAAVHDDLRQRSQALDKRNSEDPELAFMKTVDMPSGKRVEDIYVVPSVWISNERKNAGKPLYGRGPVNLQGADFGHYFPADGHPRIPVQVYSHGNRPHMFNTSSGQNMRQMQGSVNRFQATVSPPIHIPARRGPYPAAVCDRHTFKPTQNIYKVIRGHIITTLNAPKLEPVPSLTELCKAALGFATNATIQQVTEINNSAFINSDVPASRTLLENDSQVKESHSEIKTPKEFLDMQGAVNHSELKLQIKSETVKLDFAFDTDEASEKPLQREQSVTAVDSYHSLPDPLDEESIGKVESYENQSGQTISDTEDTLPENPLFTEDSNMDTSKSTLPGSETWDLPQTKVGDFKPAEQQFQPHTRHYVMSCATAAANAQNFKCIYPTNSLATDGKGGYSDYVIPIVSYKLSDTIKNNLSDLGKSDPKHLDCPFGKNDSGMGKFGLRAFGGSAPNSTSTFADKPYPYPDDGHDGGSLCTPNLISIAKEIKYLSSAEPLNKPLANLAAALNLLCNAEKTLRDSNYIMYRRVKSESKSKLGRLHECIKKLGDTIVTVGSTLQEWMKETGNRCFQTMGVLTDLYNSNIVALIELITPYFHYICEHIASCHSGNKLPSADDQSHCMVDPQPVRILNKWKDGSASNFCPKPPCNFGYSETPKSSSPKDFLAQHDYDQSMSSEEFGDGESETSVSGQTSAKPSPKLKVLTGVKRGRPLGSKNGQRKPKVGQPKSKMKQRPSPVTSKVNPSLCHDSKFYSSFASAQPSLLLPNTILVNMSSDNLWSEANATILGQSEGSTAPQSVSETATKDTINFEKAGHAEGEIATNASSWCLPSEAEENCHSIPVRLSISQENGAATLSLLDQDLGSHMEGPDLTNPEESKDAGSECSPSKKARLEQGGLPMDVSEYSDIIFALPKGVNIVVSDSDIAAQDAVAENLGTPAMAATHEVNLNGLNSLPPVMHGFQNIFFIQGSENADNYLQLDPQQFSTALISTLKDNKNVQDRYEIALMNSDQNAELKDRPEECLEGMQNGGELGALGDDISCEIGVRNELSSDGPNGNCIDDLNKHDQFEYPRHEKNESESLTPGFPSENLGLV